MSSTQFQWHIDVGCALLTAHHQPRHFMEEIRNSASNMEQFYGTSFYQTIKNLFMQHEIEFIHLAQIKGPPASNVLVKQIYTAPETVSHNNQECLCFIQFPIFISGPDISKLNKLNTIRYSITIQFYYTQSDDGKFTICHGIKYHSFYEILNLLSPINIIISSTMSGENVDEHQIYAAATGLEKKWQFTVTNGILYFGKVIISMAYNYSQYRSSVHSDQIIEDINEILAPYYCKAEVAKIFKFDIEHHYDTNMAGDNRWNIRRYENRVNRDYNNNKLLLYSGNKRKPATDILSVSLQKVVEVNNVQNIGNVQNNNNYLRYSQYEYEFSDEEEEENNAKSFDIQSVASSHYVNNVALREEASEHKSDDIDDDDISTESPSPEARNNDNATVITATNNTFIDDNLSCYQPGGTKEQNKVLQSHQQKKILSSLRRDYRACIVPSAIEYGKYAVIVGVDPSKTNSKYLLLDCDDKRHWKHLSQGYLDKFSTDICDDIEKDDAEQSDLDLIRTLTPTQVFFAMKMIKVRR